MFYYQIIPLEKIRTEKFPAFTYSHHQKIPLFSLVKIELRKRIVFGLVWSETARPNFPTKKISLLAEENFWNQNQIRLAEKISTHYFSSWGETLQLFFPFQVRQKNRFSKPTAKPEQNFPLEKKILPTNTQKKALAQIWKSPLKSFLIFGPASSGKTLVAWEIARKIIRQKKSVLVILPEIFLAHQEKDRWKSHLSLKEPEIFFVHSSIPKTVYRKKWEELKKGKIKLIIGSRSGLFLPFVNLGLIVVDEEQDLSHRQWDQVPFYDARKIAAWLAEIHSAKTLLLSATPTLEGLFDQASLPVELPRLKTAAEKVKKPEIILADLKKNFFQKNRSPLTQELINQLEKNLAEKKAAFLFVPRRGFARKIICSDCRHSLLCPRCGINLSDLGESYRCLKCGFHRSPFLACPDCGSFRLKSLGIGTEKIAREIKNRFPHANFCLADRKSFQKESQREKIWNDLKNRKIDILIGTQVIAKGFDLPFLGLTAVLEAEGLAGKNNFRFDQERLGLFFQLAGRVNRPGSDQKGVFLLQTFRPEDPLWQFLKEMDWKNWARKEFSVRKETGLPPCHQLTKLICQNKKPARVEKSVKQMYTALVRQKTEKDESFFIFPDHPQKFHKGWKQSILIKTPNPADQTAWLKKQLGKISASDDWKVEIDPKNVF